MPETELSPQETATLIDYARRKYAEERWPLAPVRPHEPSTVLQKKRR
jgi:hypothetical protein